MFDALADAMQMGELTLLPDGRAFLCNGAQKGQILLALNSTLLLFMLLIATITNMLASEVS